MVVAPAKQRFLEVSIFSLLFRCGGLFLHSQLCLIELADRIALAMRFYAFWFLSSDGGFFPYGNDPDVYPILLGLRANGA